MPETASLDILRDLAVVMAVAGAVILLFHWLRQPVILGYIIAGIIIGPYTPPFSYIKELEVINVLADIGIVLLMFSLGLEFSLKKLRRVGKVAVLGGALQILIVFTLGYQVGLLLGWGTTTALFLGAGLSVSSTALIVKVLQDENRMSDHSSQAVVGILIFEDFAAIAMIALLAGLGEGGGLHLYDVLPVLIKLAFFVGFVLALGFVVVPRVMTYVIASGRRELYVVLGLGLCFGLALMSRSLGLSVAAGAFVGGALIAEARRSEQMAHSVGPIRDMFAALFFVAIGMLLNPAYLLSSWPYILILTGVLIAGKAFAGTVATFLLGYDRHTAVRAGMTLAQIGEFSLIIVKIGQDHAVVAPFLYPVIVGVAGMTTLTTPYLMRSSIHAGEWLDRLLPPRARRYLVWAESALQRLQSGAGERSGYGSALRRDIRAIITSALVFLGIVLVARVAYEQWDVVARSSVVAGSLGFSPGLTAGILGITFLVLAVVPIVGIVRGVRSLAASGALAFANNRLPEFILTQRVARVIFRNAATALLLLVLVMLVYLLLPIIPGVPFQRVIILGVGIAVLAFLSWDSIHAVRQRFERLTRIRAPITARPSHPGAAGADPPAEQPD